jgi:hypothetical protein
MSRPGFPINAHLDITVHNSYVPWMSPVQNGADTLSNERFLFEDKVGPNTPGWPNTIQTNPYLRSHFSWHQSPLSVNGTVDYGGGVHDEFFGDWGNAFGIGWVPWQLDNNPFSLDNEVAIVKERLIGKLIDNIQSYRVNLGEVLHTRAQSASMVASTANRLAGAFMTLRKGNFVGAARYLTGADPRTRRVIKTSKSGHTTSGLGGIPEQWLALQYGWKPALQDVYNSLETVHKAWNDNGELFTANAKASADGDRISIKRNRVQGHGPSFLLESGSRTVRGRASITYGVDSNLGSSLSQLGITNPLSLAWELLPYSFVADWFLPVGSFLERLDYSRGLFVKHGYITYHARQDARLRLDETTATVGILPKITANWSGGQGNGEAFVMVRDPITDFPDVPPPRFKDPFSLTHVANALSLLTTAFSSSKRIR